VIMSVKVLALAAVFSVLVANHPSARSRIELWAVSSPGRSPQALRQRVSDESLSCTLSLISSGQSAMFLCYRAGFSLITAHSS
jgi:hypothetical protein